MKNKILEKKGITLVALVVTIVVLLILAGITISLVLGNNGIATKAQAGKVNYTNAQKEEEGMLSGLSDEIDKYVAGGSGSYTAPAGTTMKSVADNTKNAIADASGYLSENGLYTDTESNKATVPSGFKVSGIAGEQKISTGLVVEDKNGNQFVWIPVATISDYKRIDYGKQDGTYSDYSETMPNDELESVTNNHGYYIGRYETGDTVSTSNKTFRVNASSQTNQVAIKKGQIPYTCVTQANAVKLSIEMKTVQGYAGTTKLCSSYAWDTALNFIEKTVTNYGRINTLGNYSDTSFTYTDITGATKTKASGAESAEMVPTGQTTPACNIYDMGGNIDEYTTEIAGSNLPLNPCVYRGGSYVLTSSEQPVGERAGNFQSDTNTVIGFRITLFI